MIRKILKVLFLLMGIIGLMIMVVDACGSFSGNLGWFLVLLCWMPISESPIYLLAIISLVVGLVLPFNKKDNKDKQSNKKKWPWIVMLIVGIILLLVPVIIGIHDAIAGTTGFCILQCDVMYGMEAFLNTFILLSILYIPIYVLSLFFIIFSIVKLVMSKKKLVK